MSTALWTALANPGGANRPWGCLAASRDGQTIIAGVGGSITQGRLYLSTDGWETVTEAQPAGAVDTRWGTASMSHDGQTILVGEGSQYGGGRLYLSTDGGANWAEVQPAGDVDAAWRSSCMSAYGGTIYAAAYSGRVYRSDDGGVTWAETQPDGDRNGNWRCIACDTTGDVAYLGEYAARAYQTGDAGDTWGELLASGTAVNRNWRDCSVSDDGRYVLFADYQGQVYRSVLFGFTFSAVDLTDGYWWSGAQVSSSGQVMFATAEGSVAANGRRAYLSTDYGDTWAETQPAGDVTRPWQFAVISNARMFTSPSGTLYRGYQIHEAALTDIATGAPVITTPAAYRATRNETIYLEATFTRSVAVEAEFVRSVALEAEFTKSVTLDADLY